LYNGPTVHHHLSTDSNDSIPEHPSCISDGTLPSGSTDTFASLFRTTIDGNILPEEEDVSNHYHHRYEQPPVAVNTNYTDTVDMSTKPFPELPLWLPPPWKERHTYHRNNKWLWIVIVVLVLILIGIVAGVGGYCRRGDCIRASSNRQATVPTTSPSPSPSPVVVSNNLTNPIPTTIPVTIVPSLQPTVVPSILVIAIPTRQPTTSTSTPVVTTTIVPTLPPTVSTAVELTVV
jgi:hypothetical protein